MNPFLQVRDSTSNVDGRIGISTKFLFRTKNRWSSNSLWLKRYGKCRNYHFKSGVCLYYQYVSCITRLSHTCSTFQYQVLHHKYSFLNEKAIFFTNELVKWPPPPPPPYIHHKVSLCLWSNTCLQLCLTWLSQHSFK